jgi:hypothetical protein
MLAGGCVYLHNKRSKQARKGIRVQNDGMHMWTAIMLPEVDEFGLIAWAHSCKQQLHCCRSSLNWQCHWYV